MNATLKKLVYATAGFSVLAFAPTALAATSASATGDASATVIKPLALTKAATLNFGKFAAGTAGGTVVISTAGARSTTGDVNDLQGDASMAAGTFTLTGEPNAAITVTLPGAAATLTHGTDTTKTMSVGSWACKIDSAANGTTGSLAAGGSSTIAVGATLTVAASQLAGTYTGTFPVAVDYQ